MRRPVLLAMFGVLALCGVASAQKPSEGKLDLIITDGENGPHVPCRVHVKNQAGVPRKVHAMPFWSDHFACPGEVEFVLPKGNYTLLIERGPEYADHSGYFIMQGFAKDQKTIAMKRAVKMSDESWWSGDLHVRRPARDMEAIMLADDLHVAPVIVWSNKTDKKPSDEKIPNPPLVRFDGDRYFDYTAGEDRRESGTLLFFRLPKPLDVPPSKDTVPSTTEMIALAHEQPEAWVDAPSPYAWDLPLWLAAGGLDSIGVVHEQFGRERLAKQPPLGRAPDTRGTKTDNDWGQWSQRIYYNVLDAGLRIPPSAGSGTGASANSLGYNRMYVWVDKDSFDYASWWDGFKRGRVTVTNGPLIRPLANGRLPGHVFQLGPGEAMEVDIAMNMTIRDPVRYMEVIRNGQLAESIRLEDWAKTGHFPAVKIDKPGWFLVRVVTEAKGTYRFASTGPWYVEGPDETPRITRSACDFFSKWLEERALKFGADAAAEQWWRARMDQANAD